MTPRLIVIHSVFRLIPVMASSVAKYRGSSLSFLETCWCRAPTGQNVNPVPKLGSYRVEQVNVSRVFEDKICAPDQRCLSVIKGFPGLHSLEGPRQVPLPELEGHHGQLPPSSSTFILVTFCRDRTTPRSAGRTRGKYLHPSCFCPAKGRDRHSNGCN